MKALISMTHVWNLLLISFFWKAKSAVADEGQNYSVQVTFTTVGFAFFLLGLFVCHCCCGLAGSVYYKVNWKDQIKADILRENESYEPYRKYFRAIAEILNIEKAPIPVRRISISNANTDKSEMEDVSPMKNEIYALHSDSVVIDMTSVVDDDDTGSSASSDVTPPPRPPPKSSKPQSLHSPESAHLPDQEAGAAVECNGNLDVAPPSPPLPLPPSTPAATDKSMIGTDPVAMTGSPSSTKALISPPRYMLRAMSDPSSSRKNKVLPQSQSSFASSTTPPSYLASSAANQNPRGERVVRTSTPPTTMHRQVASYLSGPVYKIAGNNRRSVSPTNSVPGLRGAIGYVAQNQRTPQGMVNGGAVGAGSGNDIADRRRAAAALAGLPSPPSVFRPRVISETFGRSFDNYAMSSQPYKTQRVVRF